MTFIGSNYELPHAVAMARLAGRLVKVNRRVTVF
jgi:hypothetical protein